ncbi:unnamed protein product [Sphagnum balticum]
MDGLLEGDPVVEQILEPPSESVIRRAARSLNFVKGEYEDEDGDLATGFIIADTPPLLPSESRVYGQSPGSSHGGGGGSELGTSPCNNNPPLLGEASHSGSSTFDVSKGEGSGADFFLQTRGNTASRPELCNRKKDVVFLSDDTDGEEEESSFFCELCEESAGLHLIASMLSCTCLVCITCVQLHVVSLLTGATQQEGNEKESSSRFRKESTKVVIVLGETEDEDWIKEQVHEPQVESFRVLSRQQLEWIPCPKPSCSGQISLSACQILAPEAFRLWEEAANETLFEENAAFVKCPGCKVVFEKVIGVVPPGVALTGVPELDRTAPFIELDNEGHRLSRSAMCHKAANRFRCQMCSIDFCGLCMVCPYHLGKACEEVEEEKNSTK